MFQIPGYEIGQNLYQGIRHLVFRGTRLRDGLSVVIKIKNIDQPNSEDLALFLHEFRTVQQLHHEGIVRALDTVVMEDYLAIVLEDVEGVTLAAFLQQRPISLDLFLPMAIQLADTLEAIHQQGVIHRDIKPENILINQSGQPLLSDFGLAVGIDADGVGPPGFDEHQRSVAGSPAYMAPEQSGRTNRVLDDRCDLYALGVCFFEMLTGTLPFQHEEPAALIHAHLAVRPPVPHHRNPTIPKTLSAVVLKLLEKNPEDRYQSGAGLKADLELCRDQRAENGTISAFPLGQQEKIKKLIVSNKLYGREKQLASLQEGLQRVAQGSGEFAVVTGRPGVGKTTLIRALYPAVQQHQGYLLEGKYAMHRREVPYSAVVDAFRGLIRQILTESPQQLETWRRRFELAMGRNASLMTEVLPDLAKITGPTAPVATHDPVKFRNQFESFIRALCRAESPLVLFLDDVQWIDLASLSLLQTLAMSPRFRNLFMVISFRNNEVGPSHPLRFVLETLEKNTNLNAMRLGRLNREHVRGLIADSLHKNPGAVSGLADLLWRKTGGVPLTVRRLMLDLFHRGLLRFDHQDGWTWDNEAIEEMPLDEPLARLLQKNLASLPPATVDVLAVAACFGDTFRLTELAKVAGKEPQELGDLLKPAVQMDVVHRVRVGYAFHHDRLCEALVTRLTPEEKGRIHLKIGALELERHTQKPATETLFHVVHHFNAGVDQITDREARRRLAQQNYEAGKHAFAASAFANAVAYFDMADDLWEREENDRFWLDLQQQRLAGRYLSGDHSRSELLLRELLPQIEAPLARGRLYAVAIQLRVHEQRNAAALDMAMEALNEWQVKLPIHSAVAEEKTRAMWQHWSAFSNQTQPDTLLENPPPPMEDKEHRLFMTLSAGVLPATFHCNHHALDQFLYEMLQRSREHGFSPETAPALQLFAARMLTSHRDYREAYRLSRYALQVAEVIGAAHAAGRCQLFHGVFHQYWGEPIADGEHTFKKAVERCLEAGDPLYAAFAADAVVLNSFMHGVSLNKVIHQALKYLPFLRITRNQTSLDICSYCLHQALRLAGPQEHPDLETHEPLNETRFWARIERDGNQYLIAVCSVVSLFTALLEDDMPRAQDAVKRLQPRRAFLLHTQRLYESLLLEGLVTARAAADPKKRPQALVTLRETLCELQHWAEIHARNFGAGAALIHAEILGLEDELNGALHAYQAAVQAAKNNAAHALTALIFQQIERCFANHQLGTFAYTSSLKPQLYLRLWGMTLPGRHDDFRFNAAPVEQNFNLSRTHTTARKDLEDLAVGQALQVLAHEGRPADLLKTLVDIIVETSGAERAVLLLERERHFYVEVIHTPDPEENEVLCSIPLEHYKTLPATLLHYVLRTKETTVLHQEGDHPPFHQDPYYQNGACASAVCIPLPLCNRLIGLLYLENRLLAGLFAPSRLQMVQLIATQAAVSLRNTQLGTELSRARNDLEQSNQAMSRRIEGHSAEIEARDHELAVLERLVQVSKRKQNWSSDLAHILEEGLALLESGQHALFFSTFTKPNSVSLVASVGYPTPPGQIDMPQIYLEQTINEKAEQWESGVYRMARRDFPIQLIGWQEEEQDYRLVLLTICPEEHVEALLVFEHQGEPTDHDTTHQQIRKLARFRDHALSVYVKSKLMFQLEQSNQQLASAQEKLVNQERMAAVGALAAGIGHEIRNPLNFINNFAMVSRELTQELAVLLEQQQKFIEGPAYEEVDLLLSDITDNALLIQNHGERAAGIIKSMMLLSRGQSMHRELIDVNNLVDEYTDLAYHGLRVQQTSANVRIERTMDPAQPKIFAVAQDLSRVIINLVNNAFYAVVKKKETSDDSFQPRIRVTTQGDGDYVQIRIYDNGTGIPRKLTDRIFNPFFTTKPAGEGTGLGLPICREIIEEQHHGEMTVSSEDGFFTEFMLRLPRDSRRTGRRRGQRQAQPAAD
ncbi:ATP-binding sensor histidine kinase [Acanthopleuribacter pedis]|uniref:histidine kinase n=1 Tax=Acanthopleuribacter pedis TaxID=442870 RepID=A0A8J7QIV7_9BACT|nr:AAA family ATPase [Acanthopleuribacter pedis]MBO1321110.1 AAA family ATPase [Acanthopleuribacter pedis]